MLRVIDYKKCGGSIIENRKCSFKNQNRFVVVVVVFLFGNSSHYPSIYPLWCVGDYCYYINDLHGSSLTALAILETGI